MPSAICHRNCGNFLCFCNQGKPFTVRNIISRWAPPNENDTEAIFQGYLLAFPKNKEKLEEWLNEEDEYKDW